MATLAPTSATGNPLLDAFTNYHARVSALNTGAGMDMSPKANSPRNTPQFSPVTTDTQNQTNALGYVDSTGSDWKSAAAAPASSAISAATNYDYYDRVQTHESGHKNIDNSAGGPNAASGYFQILPTTWNAIRQSNPHLNLPSDIHNANFDQQKAGYQAFTNANASILDQAGIPPTDKNVFMSAFLGAGGAVRFVHGLQTDPGDDAYKYVGSAAAQANRGNFYHKDGTPRSLSEVYTDMTGMMASKNTTGYTPPNVAQNQDQSQQQIQIPQNHFNDANKDLNLNPQEQALYQRHLTNLYGPGGVDNPNGSRSTLFQSSFETNGKTYNIPTVWEGKILSPKDAQVRARAEGLDTFPSYPDEKTAEDRYQQMHSYMEQDTGDYFNSKESQ